MRDDKNSLKQYVMSILITQAISSYAKNDHDTLAYVEKITTYLYNKWET